MRTIKKLWQIEKVTTGVVIGVYEADTAEEAFKVFAADEGYASTDAYCQAFDLGPQELCAYKV